VSHRPSQGIPICTIFLILLQTGEICIDILKDAWAPVWTLKSAYRNHWLCWITPRPRARSTAVQALLASQSTAIDSSPHADNLIRCDDRRGFFCTARCSQSSTLKPSDQSLIGNHSFLRFDVFISKVPMHGLTSLFASPPPGMRLTFGGDTGPELPVVALRAQRAHGVVPDAVCRAAMHHDDSNPFFFKYPGLQSSNWF
jgi:hypothetical protein